ncbi:15191_t:CDS:2, partial [Cetraspora pellucida]
SIEREEKEILLPEIMAETLFNKVTSVDSNEFFENESVGIYFECNITLDNFINIEDDPHEISRKITNLVGDNDGYYYIYSNSNHLKKNVELFTFQYRCSQCINLEKKPRKHQDLEHQRDCESMERFDCGGTLRITLNIITNSASIYLKHETLHQLNSPELTQKQVHAWWTLFIQKEFIQDHNQIKSSKILLEESTYQIIMFNNDNGIKLLGFITPFFEKLKKNQEIFVDATHKTNTLGYQLYSVIGQCDGAGFALAYLFVEGNNKQDGAQTEIL